MRTIEQVNLKFHVIEWKRGEFYAEGASRCDYCDLKHEKRICAQVRCSASARDDKKNVVFKFLILRENEN